MVDGVEATNNRRKRELREAPSPPQRVRESFPRGQKVAPCMSKKTMRRTALTWALAAATTASLALPSAPEANATTLYVRADTTLRTSATSTAAAVKTVTPGAKLSSTGVKRSGYTKVRWHGTTVWIRSKFAKAGFGSRSLNRLQSHGKVAVLRVRQAFPHIKRIGGWRSWSNYSSDHRSGRAVDFMIPSWTNAKGKKLGSALARYMIANHKKLHVHYVIWRQHIWTTADRKWRHMPNRGSANANHMNHVHVSFTNG
jgi:hypothetical protein